MRSFNRRSLSIAIKHWRTKRAFEWGGVDFFRSMAARRKDANGFPGLFRVFLAFLFRRD
jgi:hypothetical protein